MSTGAEVWLFPPVTAVWDGSVLEPRQCVHERVDETPELLAIRVVVRVDLGEDDRGEIGRAEQVRETLTRLGQRQAGVDAGARSG